MQYLIQQKENASIFQLHLNLIRGCGSPDDISALRSMFLWEVYRRSLLVSARGICHRMLWRLWITSKQLTAGPIHRKLCVLGALLSSQIVLKSKRN